MSRTVFLLRRVCRVRKHVARRVGTFANVILVLAVPVGHASPHMLIKLSCCLCRIQQVDSGVRASPAMLEEFKALQLKHKYVAVSFVFFFFPPSPWARVEDGG
jgi:hypothetical protein